MEQERKIERLLKAYAKKRRGQAGDSFKLDPATRQILQNEISRSAPASEDEDETMSLWELLRKHWLYLLGFAACVFVLAALFLPITNAPMSRSFRASTTQSIAGNTRQIPASLDKSGTGPQIREPAQVFSQNVVGAIEITNANVATLTPRHLPPAAAPEPASDELVTAAGAMPAAQPELNGPVASREALPPAPAAPTLGMSDAARESHKVASQHSFLPTTEIPATAANGSYAMNSMPVNSLKTSNFGGGGGALNGLAPRKDYVETTASTSQSAAVLVNFQVSQNGNTIRVVDQDGSVYTGALESEGFGQNGTVAGIASLTNLATLNPAGLNATTRKSESPKMTQLDTPGANAEKGNNASSAPAAISSGMSTETAESPAATGPQVRTQKYFFYAAGTNQTLKKRIVFAGTLLEDLSFASNAQQTSGMSANAALGAAYAQQFMKSVLTNQPIRIQGVAIIDQTYKIEINAASVPAKNSSPPK